MSETTLTRSRRAARQAAFQALYMVQVGHLSPEEAANVVLARHPYAPSAADFIRRLVSGTVAHRADIDALIEPRLAHGWALKRLAVSDLTALRLATFELFHWPGMPPKVSISEAVEIAKAFGGKDSGAFVNGVLGTLLRESPKAHWTPDMEEALDLDEGAELPLEPDEDDEPDEEVTVEAGTDAHTDLMKAGPWVIRSEDD